MDIRVAIFEDNKLVREALQTILNGTPGYTCTGAFNDGNYWKQDVKKSEPDVILMDLKMPVKDGIETTKYLNKHFPAIRILILTMYEDERFVGHLMDSGANGYLLKSTDPEEIKQGITDVMRTGFYLNNFVNRVLIKKNYAKQKFNPNLNSEVIISEREKEVLSLVCMEYTAQEIAQKMDISSRTVEAIKDRLMERFGVKNSVGLVFFAMKNSLID